MQVACLLNAHSEIDVVLDTIESIQTYLTKDILRVVDGASPLVDAHLPVPKLKGFVHNVPRSPYRNVALGLMNLQTMYPEADWYCYTEYDCLFTSKRILDNLKYAMQNDVWILGNDGHVDEVKLPLIESLVKGKFDGSYYLLGACQFISKKLMNKLVDIDFFNKLLVMTSSYSDGFFPLYQGYDVSEHMYPTLARHFGGTVGVFATYDYIQKKWHGSHEVFTVRWKPEIDPDTEHFPQVSVIHPLKDYNHPIREHHRRIRKNVTQTTKDVRASIEHISEDG